MRDSVGMSQTRDIRHAVDERETWVKAQLADPPETKRNVEIKPDTALKALPEMMRSRSDVRKDSWFKSVLKS